MRTNDGRKLDHQTLEAIRVRAVQQVQKGESPEAVIRALGFSRICIYNWLARYREGGWEGLKAVKLNGRPPKLKGRQIRWIYNIVVTKNPTQLKFPFALWTRDMISQLILKKYGIKLSKATIGRLLAHLGLTCQRPLYRAYQQDPVAVEKWVNKEYPVIVKLAKKNKAKIFFEDEAGIRSDYHKGTTWAPRGKTPVISSTGARFKRNMVSVISPMGEMRFMITSDNMSAPILCEFITRLMKGVKKPIFLIWDGHPVHRSNKVQRCIESFEGKLRIFYLPSYAPELNPDELVWNHVKNHGIGRQIIIHPHSLHMKLLGRLRSIQKQPGLIRSFFRETHTCYAMM
jgi:transposase